MRLKKPLPEQLTRTLHQMGLVPDDLQLTFQSDIDLLGHYDPRWIVASRTHVWVFSESRPDKAELEVSIADVESFRTVAAVGAGLLQAKVNGVWTDLVRYSNRIKYWFDRVCKRLEDLRQGAQIEFGAEDEEDPRRCRSCGLLLQFSGETCPRCINRGAAMVRVLGLMKPYWPKAILMMLLLLAGIAINMAIPQLTRRLVDDVLKIDETRGAPLIEIIRDKQYLLTELVGLLALLQVAFAVIAVFNGRIASKVGTSITFDIRGRLVKHLERLGLGFYDTQQVGSLVGRVAYDTEAMHGFMNQLTSGFLMQILQVGFSAIFMFSMAPSLAFWTLLPAPFVILGSFLFYRFVYPQYHRFYDRSSKQAGMLSGLLSGIRVVKAFAQEERELRRFQESSANLRDARYRVDASAVTFYPLMGILFQAGGWCVWWFGGFQTLQGKMTLGTLMAYLGYLGMFYGPLTSLTNLTTWVTQFTTQVHRIFEILDTPIQIPEKAESVRTPDMKGEIEFQNVTFGYSRQSPVLKGVSFHIPAGKSLGIVGRSGSGKTTVINLISRFYDVDEGLIRIDGIDIRDIALRDLRYHVGVVLQEPFLFRGTIWQNLTYGQVDATPELAIASCRAANAHDFVLRQHHGYDTWVGERGAGLSGGERQRLSIARALLCDPRVLILDEATSSVDSESELAIQRAMAEVIQDRTSIIIAHRLSTLRFCDNILVIDEGRVAECGTHDQLMALNGKYARFVNLQSAGAQSEGVVDHLVEVDKQKQMNDALMRIEVDPETGLPPIDCHRARWLTPQVANIYTGERNTLQVEIRNEKVYQGAYAIRCMPVQYPSRYISLRCHDHEDREIEIGLLSDLSTWPDYVRDMVSQSLLRRYFVHTIQSIESISQFQNFLAFKVVTDLGPMEFNLRYSHDSAQSYGQGGKMLVDVEENRYVIPNVTALPHSERTLFERYIYW